MKVFKIRNSYIGSTYYGGRTILLDEKTSQKDLNFIFSDTAGTFQGIIDVPQPIKREVKKK